MSTPNRGTAYRAPLAAFPMCNIINASLTQRKPSNPAKLSVESHAW